MAAVGVGAYTWARSDRTAASRDDTRLETPAVRVLTWRDWYLELHPNGSALWYRTSCRDDVGHGRWLTWQDGAVTLSPVQATEDLESWQQLAAPGLSHLELRPDGAGYFTEEGAVIQEWSPPSGPPLPCVPQPDAPPPKPHDPRYDSRWCGAPDSCAP